MNIAFIVNNYPPRLGGLEAHVEALALELNRKGHSVTVVNIGPELGWRDDSGISVLTLPEHFRVADILGFPALGVRRKLTAMLKQREIEVVSVHTRFFPMSFVGWRAARAANLPVIHTEHGSDYVASNSPLIRGASRMVDWTLGRSVLRGADRVLGVSENVVEFVRKLANVKAEVFYNAIADIRVPTSDDHGARPGHLVFVGRLVPGKGWEAYLEALSELRHRGVAVSGEVLGDGVDLQSARGRVIELGLQDTVVVRGRVTPNEVRKSLMGATLVNPTVLSEGFQTTLLEALAAEGQIVTYPVPGAETLMAQGAPIRITPNKSLTALTDELEKVIRNPLPKVDDGFIDKWTWSARAKQYVSVCEEVLAR